MSIRIWDENGINMTEPSDTLYSNGFPLDYQIPSDIMNQLMRNYSSNTNPVGMTSWFPILPSSLPTDSHLPCTGALMGSANSGATFANDDYQNLYTFLWDNDPTIFVEGGKGASALADWTADKIMTLPDMQGVTPVGYSPDPLSEFNVAPGTIVGSETVTLTELQLPVINPVVVDPDHAHTTELKYRSCQEGLTFPTVTFSGEFDGTEEMPTSSNPTGITIEPFGGGQAHPNVQPSIVGVWGIKW